MPAMTPALLAALTQSLTAVGHDWQVAALQEHHHVKYEFTTAGDPPALSVTEIPVELRTMRIASASRDLQIVVMIEIEDGSLDHFTVHYGGAGHETSDAALYAALQALPTTGLDAKAAELQGLLA